MSGASLLLSCWVCTCLLHKMFSQNSSDCGEVFEGSENGVHTDFLKAWMEFLASNARSPQLMTQEHPVVTGLEQVGNCGTPHVTFNYVFLSVIIT